MGFWKSLFKIFRPSLESDQEYRDRKSREHWDRISDEAAESRREAEELLRKAKEGEVSDEEALRELEELERQDAQEEEGEEEEEEED